MKLGLRRPQFPSYFLFSRALLASNGSHASNIVEYRRIYQRPENVGFRLLNT